MAMHTSPVVMEDSQEGKLVLPSYEEAIGLQPPTVEIPINIPEEQQSEGSQPECLHQPENALLADTGSQILQSDSNPLQQGGIGLSSQVALEQERFTETSQARESSSYDSDVHRHIRRFITSYRAARNLPIPIDVPPSYEEALDPNAPPPQYDSIFGQVQEARRTSNGPLDFLKKLVIVLLVGTVGCMCLLCFSIVIPVVMLMLGTLYFDECPQESKIPLYLVVAGALAIAKHVLSKLRVQNLTENAPIPKTEVLRLKVSAFLSLASFIWFIMGSIWVYKEYEPSYEPGSPHYCNPTVYLFAFWLITAMYVVTTLVVCCIFCLCCVIIFTPSPPSGPAETSPDHTRSRNDSDTPAVPV